MNPEEDRRGSRRHRRRPTAVAALSAFVVVGLAVLAVGAFLLIAGIQNNRESITRANCISQNRRHHVVIQRFYRQVRPIPRTPSSAAGIKYNRDLINDILPSMNCTAAVAKLHR